jgi:hypothetical protein
LKNILSWLIFELSHVLVAIVITLLFSKLTLRFMVESFSYIGYFSLSNTNTILGDLILYLTVSAIIIKEKIVEQAGSEQCQA